MFQALAEFNLLREELDLVKEKCDTLSRRIDALKSENLTLQEKRYNQFSLYISKINESLSKIYSLLTLHGDCYLSYVQERIIFFEQGISFQVKPDRRQWKSFKSLSGGQKDLATLALSFAINKVFPSPFYLLDEVDAALDSLAVERVAKYIKQVCKEEGSQFLIVSHRPQMYEVFPTIIGTYKIFGESRALVYSSKI
eukprot:TRINITY_DN12756_c0_g1_i1.p1 TRINITY_DN12756_c0_g1~~TRINITY_DN12756_c0_g1_i1.p1  ORF type:complete len:197 (-),score=45.06 TRINITY_DN12756_c0_g1_i1:190-780(-)